MTRLRRALGRIAVACLLYQVTALTLASATVWVGAADELLECTCTHGDHAICPMHHRPAPGAKRCLMQSSDDSGTTGLISMFTAVGLVPVPAPTDAPPANARIVRIERWSPPLRPAPPDPPPPRA